MADRTIIMSAASLAGIFAGQKCQTRRVLKPQPPTWVAKLGFTCVTPKRHISGRGRFGGEPAEKFLRLPFAAGDRLWVRETHAIVPATAYHLSREEDGSQIPHRVSPDGLDWAVYKHGWTRCSPRPWRSPIFMPRWASRVCLHVESVRGERLQDISAEDATAEGVVVYTTPEGCPLLDLTVPYPPTRYLPKDFRDLPPQPLGDAIVRAYFASGWDELNAKRGFGWEDNPWVLVVSFQPTEDRTDA